MSDFIPDMSTVRRAQEIIGAYRAMRVQIVADRPGNPLRAEVRRIEGGIATCAPPFGEHPFNRASGFSDNNLTAAKAVADWYAQAGVRGAFEIVPGAPCDQLMTFLQAGGYGHTSFHTTLAGPAKHQRVDLPGVEVRPVVSDADLEAFSDAYHLGWGDNGPRVPMEAWRDAAGWRLYLGLFDGAPAGAAVLFQQDGDAYLADSAVDPRHRRRGVHRALLDRRCADAAADGAEWVFAGADYLSTSCRNMIRQGLLVLHTKAIWTAGAIQSGAGASS